MTEPDVSERPNLRFALAESSIQQPEWPNLRFALAESSIQQPE